MKSIPIRSEIGTILEELGEDLSRPGLVDTPDRVARAYAEMFKGYGDMDFEMRTFPSNYTGIIYRKGIPFTSYCEHHIAPFAGFIDFAYIPDGKVVGISKIIRFMQHHTARLWIQEDLTTFLIDEFMKILSPKGVAIVVEAYHTCEANRGVKTPNVLTGTAQVRGLFEDPEMEQKFLRLIGR